MSYVKIDGKRSKKAGMNENPQYPAVTTGKVCFVYVKCAVCVCVCVLFVPCGQTRDKRQRGTTKGLSESVFL